MHIKYFMLHKAFDCAKVICRFDRLGTVHSKRQKAIGALENLSTAHTFDYIMLEVNPGLTSCEDLTMAVDNSLDNAFTA